MALKSYWDSFLAILFPPYCVGCSDLLVNQEHLLCISCQFHLPVLDQHNYPINTVVKRLMGKVSLVNGLAYLSFSQTSIVQNIIHGIKYQGRKDVAIYFGELIGMQLAVVSESSQIDLIVPIPLHPRKHRARGYNQAAYIAKGIANSLNIPVANECLIRLRDTESQTGFWGADRFENVADAFSCLTDQLRDKHILLVDDVLTTGATISAAASSILRSGNTQLSVAVLALA